MKGIVAFFKNCHEWWEEVSYESGELIAQAWFIIGLCYLFFLAYFLFDFKEVFQSEDWVSSVIVVSGVPFLYVATPVLLRRQKGKNAIPWVLLIALIIGLGIYKYVYEESKVDRADVITGYWDGIKEHLNGKEVVKACNEKDICYYFESDIKDGHVATLYFPNGESQDVWAEIDEDGDFLSDGDVEDETWRIKFNMDSKLVDKAIKEWIDASEVGLRIRD